MSRELTSIEINAARNIIAREIFLAENYSELDQFDAPVVDAMIVATRQTREEIVASWNEATTDLSHLSREAKDTYLQGYDKAPPARKDEGLAYHVFSSIQTQPRQPRLMAIIIDLGDVRILGFR